MNSERMNNEQRAHQEHEEQRAAVDHRDEHDEHHQRRHRAHHVVSPATHTLYSNLYTVHNYNMAMGYIKYESVATWSLYSEEASHIGWRYRWGSEGRKRLSVEVRKVPKPNRPPV